MKTRSHGCWQTYIRGIEWRHFATGIHAMSGRPGTGVASASSKLGPSEPSEERRRLFQSIGISNVEELEQMAGDAKTVTLSAGEVLSLGADFEEVLFVVASGTIQAVATNSHEPARPLVAGDAFTKDVLNSCAGA